MRSSLIFSLRVLETQTPSLLTFPNFYKRYQIVDWDELVLKYFCVDCIPSIHLRPPYRGLMCVLVWVYLSMKYYENETLKTSFGLGCQYWHISHKHMRNQKGFIIVLVNCWFLLEISEFCIWLLFFCLLHLLLLSFIGRSWKRIKDQRKKTGILLCSNFILGFTTILWLGMFFLTRRNNHVSQTRHWSIL